MSIALADLVTRLQSDVPARDSVPSVTQYENCVTEAVADYARRNSLERITTISVVSGTADYDLPDDFLRMIVFEGPLSYESVIIGDEGLIPMRGAVEWEEHVTIRAGTLTITPTPTYSQDRDLQYAAGYVLNDSDEYVYLTDEDVGVLMLLAQAKALMLQANVTAHQAWQYAIGDERVNKEKLATALREQAGRLEEQYQEEVENLGGGGKALGMRAIYSLSEQAAF